MSLSASETFLHALAERTFLKLWSLPNAHRAPGKELADLVVAFGDSATYLTSQRPSRSTVPAGNSSLHHPAIASLTLDSKLGKSMKIRAFGGL